MASTKCIDDLPNEMIVEIFAYVSIEDLVHSVQHVCTRWQEAFQNTLLWRDLVYSPEDTDSDSDIAGLLQQTPKLQNLIIGHVVGQLVLCAIPDYCTQLKKLMFELDQRLPIAYLKKLVQKCPNIERFKMPADVSYNMEKLEVIGQFRKMVHLSMYEHPVHLKPLADGCPALRSFDLDNRIYLIGDLEYFLLKKKDQLQRLLLSLCITDFNRIVPLLLACTALKTFVLLSNSNADVEAFLQAFHSFNTATSLNLFHCNYRHVPSLPSVDLRIEYDFNTDKLGAAILENYPRLQVSCDTNCIKFTDEIVKNFHTLHQLQCVGLFFTKISDGGMDSISKCRNLTQLNLTRCDGLTERHMQLIIELSGLQRLVLNKCDIKGLPIHHIPSRLKHLILLRINHCSNVDQKALDQLKADMPNLIIFALHSG